MKEIDFSKLPLFEGLDRIDLAKMIPSLVQQDFRAGDVLFREGDPGDSLYIIVSGEAKAYLGEDKQESKDLNVMGHGECIGEMALLTGAPRSASVRSLTDLSTLKLTKEGFDDLLKKHHSLTLHFAGILARRLAAHSAVANSPSPGAVPSGAPVNRAFFPPPYLGAEAGPLMGRKPLIVLLMIISCTTTSLALHSAGAATPHIILTELLLAAAFLWSFDVIPYHAVSIALPMFAVLFGVSKPERAFSGFSQPYWFLALGVFALSAAILKTGLLYRLALLIMKRFPPHYLGQTFALALSGFMLTPLIPSAYGRSILASPIALTMSETMQLKKGSAGTIGIAMACLLGFGHMSFVFMNGTAACAFVLGLLPSNSLHPVTWGIWLQAAYPLGIVFFLLSYVAIIYLYHPKKSAELNADVIEAQLKTLGPMTGKEIVSLLTVIGSVVGFATEPWHHVHEAWIAMLAFLIVFAASVIDEQAIRTDIDWSFMIALGAMVGFGDILTESGLAALIVSVIKPYLEIFSGDKGLFLVAFSLAVHFLRFALPLTPALLVSMLAIMPILSSVGIDPLVSGLVALISSNPWVLRQQNSIYRAVWKATGGKIFRHEDTMKMALLHMVIVALAVGLSVPYWEHLGLIK